MIVVTTELAKNLRHATNVVSASNKELTDETLSVAYNFIINSEYFDANKGISSINGACCDEVVNSLKGKTVMLNDLSTKFIEDIIIVKMIKTPTYAILFKGESEYIGFDGSLSTTVLDSFIHILGVHKAYDDTPSPLPVELKLLNQNEWHYVPLEDSANSQLTPIISIAKGLTAVRSTVMDNYGDDAIRSLHKPLDELIEQVQQLSPSMGQSAKLGESSDPYSLMIIKLNRVQKFIANHSDSMRNPTKYHEKINELMAMIKAI